MNTSEAASNKVLGVVTEALPNTEFKVMLDESKVIHTYMSGKMKINRIRVLVGDKVEVELNPYDGKSRLVRRM